MIRYSDLKDKIMADVIGVSKEDFFLIEGKLIFKETKKCSEVKEWLERNYAVKVVQQAASNYDHWRSKYEAELFFKDLPKGIQA